MEYRRIGRSNLKASVIGMGCWAIAGDSTWGAQDEGQALDTVAAAVEAGINFFDTAEAYGNGRSEDLLGRALSGKRAKVIVASKFNSSHGSALAIQQACEGTLRRLKTEYVDLYQIHWRNRSVPLLEVVDTLDLLVRQGKIRYYGVCNFGLGDFHDILPISTIVSNQLPYSLLWRAIEGELTRECWKHGVGVLAYSPLAWGLLTGKFAGPDDVPEGRARTRHFSSQRPQARHGEPGFESQTFQAIARIREISERAGHPMTPVSLAWLLSHREVSSVIAGLRSPEQVRENVRAAGLHLPTETVKELDTATEELKRLLGSNADMWQGVSRFH